MYGGCSGRCTEGVQLSVYGRSVYGRCTAGVQYLGLGVPRPRYCTVYKVPYGLASGTTYLRYY